MSKKLSHVLLIGVGLFSSTWVMAAVNNTKYKKIGRIIY